MTINYSAIDSFLTNKCGSDGNTTANCQITPASLKNSVDLYQLIINDIAVFAPQIEALNTNLSNITNSITSSVNYAVNGFIGNLPFTPNIINIPSLNYAPLDNILPGCGIDGITNKVCELSVSTLYPTVDLYQLMVDIVEIVEEKIPLLESNINILDNYANNLFDFATHHTSIIPPIFPCISAISNPCISPSINSYDLLDNILQLKCGTNGVNNGKCLITPSDIVPIDIYQLAINIINTSNNLGLAVYNINNFKLNLDSFTMMNEENISIYQEAKVENIDFMDSLPIGIYIALF